MNSTREIAARVQDANDFVSALALPRVRRTRGEEEKSTAEAFIERSRNQAMVVGGDIVSFVSGTDPQLRSSIVNCSLLAQLAANRKVPAREDIQSWYLAYFETLERIGWAIQEKGFSEHRETGEEFETNKAILSVASSILGPATTALAVVESTLTALKNMSQGSWITLFRRESQIAKAARFQVTVVTPASNGGCNIALMAFELDAKVILTQVLFVKYRSADVVLKHTSGNVSIDRDVLNGITKAVSSRVAEYVNSYVQEIPI